MVLTILTKNWYIFLISIIMALFCARLYIGHTLPVYRSSVTILVNESENRPVVDNTELLQGLGLPGGMKNLQNQIMILRSRALTEMTLTELPFDIEYYFKTIRNSLPVYPEMPVRIVADNEIPLPRDTEFSITFLGINSFTISSESEYYSLQKTASFGENIETPNGNFRIELRNEDWIKRNQDRILYFTIYSRIRLISSYSSRINVELLSRDGTILNISMVGTNSAKDVDFLNKHVENFQLMSLTKKNTEAERRIQFIDDQLVGISDSLSLTENKLQQFRSANKVMDLSAQGQAIIGQVTLLENERARLSLEANYYDYLVDYLGKDVTGELPIVPVTMGITDPGLARLVDELTELQSQLATRGAGELNPLQRNLERQVRSTKEVLLETLNGLRRANSLARSENQEQINRVNSRASALPVTERQLLGIERKFRLNDELYTFLLETRAEQQMQKASNRADSEVIDPADVRFSSRVSPDPTKVYFVGLLAGAGIPFILMFLIFIFNKILQYEDIHKMTSMPIVGNIPHKPDKTNLVVLESPGSALAESFRLLRSRLQFLTKEASSPVILVTSSMPSDGKTFISMNLASVYSLLGKKTVLIGFDLRNPGIYKDFNLKNEKGVSTWLIGQDKLEAIIQPTSYDNLSIITAGPIPPNPSELTALAKTEELIKQLRGKYDFIIIDTSPIGIVSDTYHLAALADVSLLIVRAKKTMRDVFEKTLNEINERELHSISMIINDVPTAGRHYGYGEKYGYTSSNERKKRSIRRRRT